MASTPVSWHSVDLAVVLREVDATVNGLSSHEAAARLSRFGPNSFRRSAPVSIWRVLAGQLRSIVVWLLIVAAVGAWLVGDLVESAAVLTVVLVNTTLGTVIELRARNAMSALLHLESPRATVMRDDEVCVVDSHLLVPGDVILLQAGQGVPADARIISATELRTNESALTGESLPADKNSGPLSQADTALADRSNMVYMATAVVAGSARAVVVATGSQTEVGHIGTLLNAVRPESTPLERRLDALGVRLAWVTLLVSALVVVSGMLRNQSLRSLIETGLALAVAAMPEGLPAVATIALAVGVTRMARRNAVVRRLPVVEALGSATVICTDKTGTLTAGEMTVVAMRVADHEYTVTGAGYSPHGQFTSPAGVVTSSVPEHLTRALQIGALCNRSSLSFDDGAWEVQGDPTEAAFVVAATKAGIDIAALRQEWRETAEIPFSTERMLMATFHNRGGSSHVLVKGAPGSVMERCTRTLTADGAEKELDEATRERVSEWNRTMASRGLRVLALADARTDKTGVQALDGLTLVGLAGISDPPAEGVRQTIETLTRAGIRTLMLTGDQRLTAEAVARDLGILRADERVIEGRDLHDLTPAQLAERIRTVAVMSRVTPETKLKVVEALQLRGDIVAMLGDGVNDAPALKKADIGVAMGMRGTDVAKEAAAVVLRDDRFQTIAFAVEEGRVIFHNIRKFSFYLFSCNLAEVLIILVASLSGLPQPLLPLQILWLNIVTDTFPALSLAIEPGDPDVMDRPPMNPRDAILSRPFLARISIYAVLITAVTISAFLWSLDQSGADLERAVTVAFMTLALTQVLHLGNARSDRHVLRWKAAVANRWALGAVAITIALQCAALYVPPLANILGVVPLTGAEWLVVLAFAAIPAVAGQTIALVLGSASDITPAVRTTS